MDFYSLSSTISLSSSPSFSFLLLHQEFLLLYFTISQLLSHVLCPIESTIEAKHRQAQWRDQENLCSRWFLADRRLAMAMPDIWSVDEPLRSNRSIPVDCHSMSRSSMLYSSPSPCRCASHIPYRIDCSSDKVFLRRCSSSIHQQWPWRRVNEHRSRKDQAQLNVHSFPVVSIADRRLWNSDGSKPDELLLAIDSRREPVQEDDPSSRFQRSSCSDWYEWCAHFERKLRLRLEHSHRWNDCRRDWEYESIDSRREHGTMLGNLWGEKQTKTYDKSARDSRQRVNVLLSVMIDN